jgi:hypothetical protein
MEYHHASASARPSRFFLGRANAQSLPTTGGQPHLIADATHRSSRLTAAPPSARERARVRRHLIGAEQGARRQAVALDPLRALNRALLLDELGRYRRRGRFPLNHDRRGSAVPIFVDAHGTRCAVAHLMDVSGQGELVRHIAATQNFARVRELARLPELRAWLAAAGLSLEEAARIQPEYCGLTEAEVCFCQSGALPQVVVGTLLNADSEVLVVRVDRVDGPLPGVAVGDELDAYGNGLVGQQRLFAQIMPDTPAAALGEAQLEQVTGLVIRDGAVYCQGNPDTAKRPVSIDTAIEALRTSETAACVQELVSEDSLWNRSPCEGGSGRGGIGDSEGGCGLIVAPAASLGGVALTSVALFAALVARRYRRNGR